MAQATPGKPVSYTHLDVYKRQALDKAMELAEDIITASPDMDAFRCV